MRLVRGERGEAAALTADLAVVDLSSPTKDIEIDRCHLRGDALDEQGVAAAAGISQAIRFLLATPYTDRPKPLLPTLRKMFHLSSLEAVHAIRACRDVTGAA